MDFLERKENTDIECHLCHNNGITTKGFMALLTVCHKCNGHGWVDWVAGAVTGSIHKPEINKQIQMSVAHQNIHRLRHKIIDIGMEVGFHITVDIKTLKTDGMIHPEFPKLMKPGG